MEDISKFIVDNWQPLISAFLSLVALILVLVKKKPIVNSLLGWCQFIIANQLPGYIIQAEKSGMIGPEKKNFALSSCIKCLKFLMEIDEAAEKEAMNYFDKAIESILSTPRKKS